MKSRELNKVALVSIASYICCSIRVSFPFLLSNLTPTRSILADIPIQTHNTEITMSHTLATKTFYLLFLLLRASFAVSKAQPANFDEFSLYNGGKHWNGWSQVNRIFAFGASYTATGFNWKTGVQPSPNNPLGNPSSYKGHTATNGPNFVMYLTTKYNKSPTQTYDFAWGGSPVSGMVRQVEKEFVPNYAGKGNLDPGWDPATTLFAIFVGINDLDSWGKGTSYRDNTFKQYSGAIDTLYSAGARNFVIYTVPPIDRGPEFQKIQKAKRTAIDDYNGRIAAMLETLSAKHTDATFWKVNMYAIFQQVLDDPSQFPQTKDIKDTSTNCAYYASHWMRLPSMDYKNPSCKYPVNQYAWLNGRHVTYPLHDLLAKITVDALEA
ncbi:MAG: hypothetical protein Q9195_000001 [Heterodermia aff. obscurata]